MTRVLTFDDFERAVICAVICWPLHALPLVPDVEVDDFGAIFCKHTWTAIRNLEAASSSIDILAVADAIFADYQFANDGKCTVHDEIEILIKLSAIVEKAPYSGGPEKQTRELARCARALRAIRYAREESTAG